MIPVEQINCYILAGGQSKRMGRDKGLLEWRGKPFVAHIRDAALQVFTEVWIVASQEEYARRFSDVMPDGMESCGPLGGLCSALRHSEKPYVMLLGCDMPGIDATVLRYFLEHTREATINMSICLQRENPLFALYSRELLPAVQQLVQNAQLRMMKLTQMHKTNLIDLSVWKHQLRNIHTPEQYHEILQEP